MNGNAWRRAAAALAIAAAAGAAPGRSGAEEEMTRLDPVVVTATRIEQRASEQASAVSVVTREEMRERDIVSIGDAIRALPSVGVQQSGRQGTLEQVRIRGADTSQVLVMIDGIPVNSPSSGNADLADLLAAGVERIEVVRGAQSALYGSSAIGGVVNIITRKPAGDKEFRSSLEAGSHATVNAGLGAAGGGRGAAAGVDAALLASGGERDNDDYSNATINLRLAGRPMEGTVVSVLGLLTEARKDLPVEVPFDPVTFNLVQYFDPNSTQRRFFTLLGGTVVHEVSPKAAVEFKTALQRQILENTDEPEPGDPFALSTKEDAEKRYAEARATVRLASWNTLILGGQYTGDAATFSGDVVEHSMHNRSLFLQEELRWGRFLGSAGVRYDDHSFAGSKTSTRISAAVKDLPGGLKWKASYGTGFRSPTLVDLFFPGFSNPDLRSESARSYETGLEWRHRTGRLAAEVDYFYLRFRDLIDFSFQTGKPENVGKAFTRGVEAFAEGRVVPDLVLGGAYTYLETQDQASRTELLRRPRNQYRFYARLFPGRALSARVDYTIVSSARGLQITGFPERNPGWERVDLTASYSLPGPGGLPGPWRIKGRIVNLLDRKYSEVEGFPSPRFNFLLGAEVTI